MWRWNLALAGSMLCVATAATSAQESKEPKEKTFPVAILNVDKAFRAYKPLQDQMGPLKSEVQELEKTVQLRQVELETIQQKLLRATPESGEGPKLQQQFIKLQNELRAFVDKERKGMQKREAKLHADVYRIMEDEVKTLCKAKGIKLVIRQSEGDLGDEKIEEVLKALNRGIIYADDLDITDAVIKAMEGRKLETSANK